MNLSAEIVMNSIRLRLDRNDRCAFGFTGLLFVLYVCGA